MKSQIKVVLAMMGLLLFFGIQACKEEVPLTLEEAQSGLYGQWVLQEVHIGNCNDVNDEQVYSGCTEKQCLKFEFNKDSTLRGIFTENGVEDVGEGNFTIHNDLLSISIDGEEESARYTLSDSKLKLIFDEEDNCYFEMVLTKDE